MLLGAFAFVIAAAKVPAPSPTPKVPLRTIIRVQAQSKFCQAFIAHFNGAVTPLLEDDANIGYIDFTLGNVEEHYHQLNRELLLYNDRVNTLHYVGTLQARVVDAQSEVNALRNSAALATDPADAAATRAIASRLQTAVDHQQQVATDTQGVGRAMMEIAMDPVQQRELASSIAGGYDPDRNLPAAERDVRTYIKLQKQEDRIGDAEGDAAVLSDDVAQRCGAE